MHVRGGGVERECGWSEPKEEWAKEGIGLVECAETGKIPFLPPTALNSFYHPTPIRRGRSGTACVWATLAEYDGDDGSEEERARVFRGYDGVIAGVAVVAPEQETESESRNGLRG